MADSAALTIRRNFPRPSPDLVAALTGVPTGYAVDAQGRRGALDWRIRPITRKTAFCGVALTVHTRPRDNLGPYAALEYARKGDVLVIATNAYEEASVVGDILLGMARNKGVVAMVTDGMVRDVAGLNEVGIPVFARGLSPNSPFKDGPSEIGLSISIGGVTVTSGDVVLGDDDGVVVVPQAALGAAVSALEEVKAKEKKMDQAVRSGAGVPDWLPEAFRTKGVRFVD